MRAIGTVLGTEGGEGLAGAVWGNGTGTVALAGETSCAERITLKTVNGKATRLNMQAV